MNCSSDYLAVCDRKRPNTSPVAMEKFPGDVLSNIFIRLLAKQLAQMRCVCKPWNTLLSEPSFIKSHLHRSIHKNDEEEILLFFEQRFSFDSIPAAGPLLAARSSHSPHIELTNFTTKLKFPVNPQHTEARGFVIGSVNGLICFSYESTNRDYFIRIWNPSLSAVLTLPPSSFCITTYHHLSFGFDPKNDDYKVVRLPFYRLEEPNMVKQWYGEVYSMRKGSWKIISQTIPSNIKRFHSHNQVCIDGNLHWLCVPYNSEWRPRTIITFDLGAETYGEILLPAYCITNEHKRSRISLGVLGGKLCVMSNFVRGECEVWVMDDDESWVKNHAFSRFSEIITPYRFTLHNEFLFQVYDTSRFALYDPVAAKTKIFNIKLRQEAGGFYLFIVYLDSLVWIAPANQLQKQK